MNDSSPAISPPRKLRIGLIGPVLPYRGGIAQYTTQLHHALRNHSELQTVSFKRQYPQWLYPGATDKAAGAEAHPEAEVEYTLDIYNPLTWRRAADRIAKNGCDLVVLDWWTLIWQPGFAYIARRLRKHGIKTVFLCHNLFDHDAHGVKRKLSEKFLKQADAYIVQSSEQKELLRGIKPGAELLLKVHPIYDRFPAPAKQLPKRGRLEVLSFGFIRPYKGLDTLLAALGSLQDSEVYPTIVGEVWGDVEALHKQIAEASVPNLETNLSYVNDAEAANYFARADVVALPYHSATGSGVVALAYYYGKPVVASAVGGLKDAVINGETGWLITPENPTELASVLKDISRQQAAALVPAIEAYCRENSWDRLAMSICEMARTK